MNSAPTISGSPSTSITAGATYTFQPVAADVDGDPLSFTATNLPTWASINQQTGAISGSPSSANAGVTAAIVVSVSDGEAAASLPPFQINVINPTPPPPPPPSNSAPTISGAPSTSVTAGSAYSFTPSGSDPDGQTLTYSIANKPAWAAFNTTTGRLSGTPTSGNVGTYANIVISASDGALSAALPNFTITVNAAPNRAPTISGTPPTSVTAGSAYSFTPTGSDPDGQTLTYSILNRPVWATFNTSTGRLSGTPTSGNVGSYPNIVISASDGTLSAALPSFAITVNAAPNNAPTISGTPPTSVVAGSAYSFTPTASDADGNTLAFSITNKPSWAVFSTATGNLSGTPTTGQAGSYLNIVIRVSDGTVSTPLAAFAITVSLPVPTGTATLSWTAPTQNTDGSALTDLAGFRVYHGTSATALNDMVQLPGSSVTSYVYNQLPSGTHYFAVAAYNTSGVESSKSSVGSKVIP